MVEPRFRKGIIEMPLYDKTPFHYPDLPDDQKRQLCLDLLSEFGATKITERGEELVHNCVLPWHDDQNPSAQMNWDGLVYKCFSCDSGGGLLWLIATCRGENEAQSRNWLRGHVSYEEGEDALSRLLDYFDSVYASEAPSVPIPKMSTKALDPWRVIHPYVTEIRGVPEANAETFEVGYGTFRTQKVNSDEWIDSERIVVPHFWKGDLVGWQTRRLITDGTAKWQSSPDFPKKTTIFNFDPRTYDTAVVVEAPFTVVAKGHLAHMVATFGAGVTDRQTKLLAQYRRVILWMDNDDAGYRAVLGRDEEKGREIIHRPGLGEKIEAYSPVWVVDSPYDVDPADLDDDTVSGLIEEAAVPFSAWQPPDELTTWQGAE